MTRIPLCAWFSDVKYKRKCGAGRTAPRDCHSCPSHRAGPAADVFEESDDQRQTAWDLTFAKMEVVGV